MCRRLLFNTPTRSLHLDGFPIPIVPTQKYLGLLLDSKLNFGPHVDSIRNRCLRRLNILRCIAGQNWGADRTTLLRFYTSLIRPILEYNSFLFDNISQTRKASLEAVQNQAIRIITGAFRTSPTCSLLADINLPSLQQRRLLLLTRYSIRVNAIHNHPSLAILTNVPRIPDCDYNRNKYTIAKNLDDIRTIALQLPDITPSFTPKLQAFWTMKTIQVQYLIKDPKRAYSNSEICDTFNDYKLLHCDSLFLYTDGSLSDSGVGAGIFGIGVKKIIRLSNYHSIFSAELIAIREAFSIALESKWKKVVICTDSRSSANLIEARHNCSHPIVNEIRHLNQKRPPNKTIIILWIPGHTGIAGNEKADAFAKQSLLLPAENNIPCPANDLINYAGKRFRAYLQGIWETKHKHLNLIKPRLGFWQSSNQGNRKQERILARLRIGHTGLTHQYIFDRVYGLNHPPRCQACEVPYTIEHFLLLCPIHRINRRPILDFFRRNQLHPTLPALLGNEYPELIQLLFIYLRNTRLELFI